MYYPPSPHKNIRNRENVLEDRDRRISRGWMEERVRGETSQLGLTVIHLAPLLTRPKKSDTLPQQGLSVSLRVHQD